MGSPELHIDRPFRGPEENKTLPHLQKVLDAFRIFISTRRQTGAIITELQDDNLQAATKRLKATGTYIPPGNPNYKPQESNSFYPARRTSR
jgi:hypothetical protein